MTVNIDVKEDVIVSNDIKKSDIEAYVSSRFTFFWGDGTGEVSKELIKKYLIQYRKFPDKKAHILNMIQVMTNYFNRVQN